MSDINAAEMSAEQIEARDALLTNWLKAKSDFMSAQQLERDLRSKVQAMLFPNPRQGAQRYPLGRGYGVKLVHDLQYDLGDKDEAKSGGRSIEKQVQALEDAICALGNEGPALAERLIRWKPELSPSEYRKLDCSLEIQAKIKELIDALLTTKPKSPQIDLEEPKASGK